MKCIGIGDKAVKAGAPEMVILSGKSLAGVRPVEKYCEI
jgi:hypothetical protein